MNIPAIYYIVRIQKWFIAKTMVQSTIFTSQVCGRGVESRKQHPCSQPLFFYTSNLQGLTIQQYKNRKILKYKYKT